MTVSVKKKNKKKIKWQKKSEVLLLTVCVKQHCEGEGEVRRRAGGRRRPCGPCHPYSPSHHGRTPEQSLNITGKNWTDQKTLTRSRVPSFVFLPSFHPHSYFFFFSRNSTRGFEIQMEPPQKRHYVNRHFVWT